MRAALVAVGIGLVAVACSEPLPDPERAGPGTTAPISVEAAVTSPPAEVPALRLELITDGLDEPVAIANRPGDDRLYVAQRLGRVVIVDDDHVATEPFLDLSETVYGPISEQGLLGITFDTDGDRFFAFYTDQTEAVQIVSYPVEGDAIDPGSATQILTVEQPHMYHQGGAMTFGPDGYLWIGLGDGGGNGDPNHNGQNPGTLLASILRLDVDAGTPYVLPPENPFLGSETAAGELWAYGLRQPWRLTFDGGFVYIADVGQYEREEVNVVPLDAAGSNFGWPIREGDICYEAETCARDGLVEPTFIIPHERSCALIGGPVYRGDELPALEGHYFYADYCVGWVRSFLFNGEGIVAEHDWEADLGTPGHITTFGVDAAGEMLLATQEGGLHRIVPAS